MVCSPQGDGVGCTGAHLGAGVPPQTQGPCTQVGRNEQPVLGVSPSLGAARAWRASPAPRVQAWPEAAFLPGDWALGKGSSIHTWLEAWLDTRLWVIAFRSSMAPICFSDPRDIYPLFAGG